MQNSPNQQQYEYYMTKISFYFLYFYFIVQSVCHADLISLIRNTCLQLSCNNAKNYWKIDRTQRGYCRENLALMVLFFRDVIENL